MSGVGAQPELALEQRGAPRRVHNPARAGLAFAVELGESHPVQVVTELDALYTCSLSDIDAQCSCSGRELVLEKTTIDLVVIVRREDRCTHLQPLRDVAVS